MNPAKVMPVHGFPFLTVGDTLVVSDLHIGIERTLLARGFNFPSGTDKLLDSVVKQQGERLLILGDMKDTVARTGDGLATELRNALDRLTERFSEVTLVKGNHDGGLPETVTAKMTVCRGRGTVRHGAAFTHGHASVSTNSRILECKTLVMGHTHPRVTFIDRLGRENHEPCWVRFPVKEGALGNIETIIVMPASNQLCGGVSVNRTGERLLGPLLKDDVIERERGVVTLLDGTDLGAVGDLYF